MIHVSTKKKRKHEVTIYENKRARGRHKGKGYTIATKSMFLLILRTTEIFSKQVAE